MNSDFKKSPQYKSGANTTDLIKLTLENNGFKVRKTSEKVDMEDAIDLIANHPTLGEFKIDCKKILSDYYNPITLFFGKLTTSQSRNIPYFIAKGPFKPGAETTYLALKLNDDDVIKLVPFYEFILLNFFDKFNIANCFKFFSSLSIMHEKQWDEIELHKWYGNYKQFFPVLREYFKKEFLNQERLEKGSIGLIYNPLDKNKKDDMSYILQIKKKDEIIYPKKTLYFKISKDKPKQINKDVQVNI